MPESVVHYQTRMPPALHERLTSLAKAEKVSLNALVVGLLENALEGRAAASDQDDGRRRDGR